MSTNYTIELWKSETGNDPGDFSLLYSFPDSGQGFSEYDTEVESQYVYSYKARRLDNTTGNYSGWSPIVYVRALWPNLGVNNNMSYLSNTNIGIQSILGIAVEAVEGQGCKAQRLLDRVSGSLEITKAQLRRKTMRGVPSPIGSVPGTSKTAGSIVLEFTPEGTSQVLSSLLGAPVTTTIGNNSGQLTAPATAPTLAGSTTGGTLAANTYYVGQTFLSANGETTLGTTSTVTTTGATSSIAVTYGGTIPAGTLSVNTYVGTSAGTTTLYGNSSTGTITITALPSGAVSPPVTNTSGISGPSRSLQTWSDSFAQLPCTLLDARGTSFYSFTGCRANRLELRLDKTQNDPVQLTMEYMALNQVMYSSLTDLGLDTATFDPLPAYSPVDGAVSISNSVTTDIRSAEVTILKNVGERQVLNGYMGPYGQYAQNSELTGTYTAYFSSDAELKQYLGNASTITVPYGAQKNIIYVPMNVSLNPVNNAAGFPNAFVVNMNNAAYEAVGQPITGPDAIMQQIRFVAYLDPITGSMFQVTMQNSQSNAAIITPGTAITHTPANGVLPFTN